MKKWRGCFWLAGIWFLLIGSQALAMDINDKFSLEGVLAGAYQHQSLSDAAGYDDTGRGALIFEPAMYLKLTDRDSIYASFGFGAGDGLADGSTSPFYLSPWAVNTESSVKQINGRNRDYLLTANYMHKLDLGGAGFIDLIGGLIDATAYMDQNAYANCGFSQFMNSTLVNGPNNFLPSYDLGGAALWEMDTFSASLVGMNVGENEFGNSYNFYGAQLGYTLRTGLGDGHYRINANRTSEDFEGPDGAVGKSRISVISSCDQALGDILGVWFRVGWQDDDALVNYRNLISGGVDIKGSPWGRDGDNIGFGYAYLDDGNDVIDKSEVVELYYRWVLNDYAAMTLDFQYVEDKYTDGYNPSGLISGVRFSAAY